MNIELILGSENRPPVQGQIDDRPPVQGQIDEMSLHQDAMNRTAHNLARRRYPRLFREIFGRKPLIRITDSEVPGSSVEYFVNEEGKYVPYSSRRIEKRILFRNHRTIDIPISIINDLNEKDPKSLEIAFAAGDYMIADFLATMCELNPGEFTIGTILHRKSNNESGKITGYSIHIAQAAYDRMAREALHLMADPETGHVMTGFLGSDLYKDAFRRPDSELSAVVANLCEYGGLTKRECTELITRATQCNNSHFSAAVQRHSNKAIGR